MRRGYYLEESQWEVDCSRCLRECPPGRAYLHRPGDEAGYYTCALCGLREGVPRAEWLLELLSKFPLKCEDGREVKPYPYQAEDAEIVANTRAKLIGSQMGTGKTPTTALAIPPDHGCMIFCPSSVKWNWARELAIWRPDLRVTLPAQKGAWRVPGPGKVTISGYGLLPGEPCPECKKLGKKQPGQRKRHVVCTHPDKSPNPLPRITTPTVLIADEVQYLQNHNQRRVRWDKLRDRVWEAGGRIYGLTGTVTSNGAGDLLSILEALKLVEASFGSAPVFYDRFRDWFQADRGERRAPWGEERDEVLRLLKPVRICRLRRHVLKYLPPVQNKEIKVPLTKETLHEVNEAVQRLLATRRAWKDVASGVIKDPSKQGLSQDERDRRKGLLTDRVEMYFETRPWVTDTELEIAIAEILNNKHETPEITELARVRSILSQAKLSTILELVEEHEFQEEPLVVFCQHVKVLERAFEDRYGWALYTGKVPQRERDRRWQGFQGGTYQHGIALSITAGGEGINLTRASAVMFVDRHFNPAKNRQARDRLVRPGAEIHDSITAYYLVADHAVDRLVDRLLKEKEELQDSLEDEEASMAGLDKLEAEIGAA